MEQPDLLLLLLLLLLHTALTAILPGEPGLASCPLILLLHLFLDCASFWDRPKLLDHTNNTK